MVVRPGRGLVLGRGQMPLADHERVVSVWQQYLAQHALVERQDGGSDDGHPVSNADRASLLDNSIDSGARKRAPGSISSRLCRTKVRRMSLSRGRSSCARVGITQRGSGMARWTRGPSPSARLGPIQRFSVQPGWRKSGPRSAQQAPGSLRDHYAIERVRSLTLLSKIGAYWGTGIVWRIRPERVRRRVRNLATPAEVNYEEPRRSCPQPQLRGA